MDQSPHQLEYSQDMPASGLPQLVIAYSVATVNAMLLVAVGWEVCRRYPDNHVGLDLRCLWAWCTLGIGFAVVHWLARRQARPALITLITAILSTVAMVEQAMTIETVHAKLAKEALGNQFGEEDVQRRGRCIFFHELKRSHQGTAILLLPSGHGDCDYKEEHNAGSCK